MERALLAFAIVLANVACGGPSAATAISTPRNLFTASGTATEKPQQYSFVAPSKGWAIDWSYTCVPTTDLYALCALIVGVYGSDGKMVDEITPPPTKQAASATQVETLGAGTFYLMVSSTGTSKWSVAVRSGS